LTSLARPVAFGPAGRIRGRAGLGRWKMTFGPRGKPERNGEIPEPARHKDTLDSHTREKRSESGTYSANSFWITVLVSGAAVIAGLVYEHVHA
jgi:hypothetical protein